MSEDLQKKIDATNRACEVLTETKNAIEEAIGVKRKKPFGEGPVGDVLDDLFGGGLDGVFKDKPGE